MKNYEDMFKWHSVAEDGMPKVSGYYWIQPKNSTPFISYYSPDYAKAFYDGTHPIAWAGRLEINDYRREIDI